MRAVALFLLATLLPLVPFLLWLARRSGPATRSDVAEVLEAFSSGTGRRDDWDRFLSAPLDDPELEAIRNRCARLPEEFPPRRPGEYCSEAGRDLVRSLASQLRQASPKG